MAALLRWESAIGVELAYVADVADLAGTVIDYVKSGYCPVTLNSDAATCGPGAGGLAIVALSLLIVVTFAAFKDVATQVAKDRPIGIAVIIGFVLQSIYFRNSYAVYFTFAIIAAWFVFAKALAAHQLSFRARKLRLDNGLIVFAPIMYFLVLGVGWTIAKLHPAPPKVAAIVLLADPRDIERIKDVKNVITQIRTALTDVIGNQIYEVMPPQKLINDFNDYAKNFAVGWNDLISLPNAYADLKDRKIEFVRSSMTSQPYGKGEGWLELRAEARSLDPAEPARISLENTTVSVTGMQKSNDLMFLLLSFPIIKNYAAGNSSAEESLSRAYASEFKIAGTHLIADLSDRDRQQLKDGCTTFACVNSIASAFRDALDDEFQDARSSMAQKADDGWSSALILLDLNRAPQTQ